MCYDDWCPGPDHYEEAIDVLREIVAEVDNFENEFERWISQVGTAALEKLDRKESWQK